MSGESKDVHEAAEIGRLVELRDDDGRGLEEGVASELLAQIRFLGAGGENELHGGVLSESRSLPRELGDSRVIRARLSRCVDEQAFTPLLDDAGQGVARGGDVDAEPEGLREAFQARGPPVSMRIRRHQSRVAGSGGARELRHRRRLADPGSADHQRVSRVDPWRTEPSLDPIRQGPDEGVLPRLARVGSGLGAGPDLRREPVRESRGAVVVPRRVGRGLGDLGRERARQASELGHLVAQGRARLPLQGRPLQPPAQGADLVFERSDHGARHLEALPGGIDGRVGAVGSRGRGLLGRRSLAGRGHFDHGLREQPEGTAALANASRGEHQRVRSQGLANRRERVLGRLGFEALNEHVPTSPAPTR